MLLIYVKYNCGHLHIQDIYYLQEKHIGLHFMKASYYL